MRVLPHSVSVVVAILWVGASGLGYSQQPAPAGSPAAPAEPKNLLPNASFESAFRRTNPWSGINQGGFLQGLTGTVDVLTQSGSIGETPMPISVAVADMNGDGRPDIVTSDVVGYFRVYFNQGTPQEAKFDDGELIPVFLTRVRGPVVFGSGSYYLRAQRISVGNFSKSGKNDMLIGNYIGQVLWLKNQGSPSAPDFRQPKDRNELLIPTTEEVNRRWGNVFAPAAWDWNGDGRFDIILGEGSYSANNIHLLLNQGANNSPRFNEKNRHILAFGDGREQLTPAVVDYNNDGKMDLLVADRSGKIGVYLNTYAQWKPDDEIKFSSYVPIQGQAGRDMTIGGITTVTTGDLNGDQLFDLVIGKNNGRIAVAYNRGTPTEPKFDAPVEIKGDIKTPPIYIPSGWDVDFGLGRGNFYGYVNVVANEPTETTTTKPPADMAVEKGLTAPAGEKALKFGYFPNTNQIIRTPLVYTGQMADEWNPKQNTWSWLQAAPANAFGMTTTGNFRLVPGKTYVLTFKAKGKNVSSAKFGLSYLSVLKLGEKQVERVGDRVTGAVKVVENEIREDRRDEFEFKPGGNWTPFTKEFKVQFRDPRLNEKPTSGRMEMMTILTPGTGELYLDDVQLIEKK